MDDYAWADDCINSSPGYQTGFTQLLAAHPYRVPAETWNEYRRRLTLIRTFQDTSLEIFREALAGKAPSIVLKWLLNDSPASLGLTYHRSLEDRHFTVPQFFRTDEAVPGKITEVQCPGSLWGDLQLTYEHMQRRGEVEAGPSPATQFAEQLSRLLGTDPQVHHMLDNASAPSGARYFIGRTRPMVKYWGVDPDVRVGDCNFVRSHSFFGLCADNEFRSRMDRVGRGVTYDLPPHVLFDQKAALVLPYWSLTRDRYADEIRDFILFSTPVLPTGLEIAEGVTETLKEFSDRPRGERGFYLKYAGCDVSLNWGSKAVYRLSNMNSRECLDRLESCAQGSKRGHIWLLQQEDTQDDMVTYLTRSGEEITSKLRAKFSAFYGPFDCLGVLAMHGHHNKVHGRSDTVVSWVLADGTSDQPWTSRPTGNPDEPR